MTNEVTNRFVRCVEQLKKQNKIKSYRQFALSVDYLPQGLNSILKGQRNAPIELIQKSCKVHQFNINYLFGEKATMFTNKASNDRILTIVVDNNDVEKIVHIPISAHAGYPDNISNPVYFDQLNTFSLPGFGFNTGTYRCFDVAGDSMEPSIHNHDQLICSYIDPQLWNTNIRSHMVYVIITMDSILVKRVKRVSNNPTLLQLVSDNKFYDPFTVNLKEVKEIWTVKHKLSPFLSRPIIDKGFQENFEHMSTTVTEQSFLIKNLNHTIQRLLHQSNTKHVNND